MSVEPTSSTGEAPAPKKTPVRSQGMIRLITVVGITGLAVWFAPVLVATTGLRQQIPSYLAPWHQGTVEIGSAALGWMSPVVARNVIVRSDNGELLASIPELRTEHTLWQFLVEQTDLGLITLVKPQANLIVWPEGSNLEEVIHQYYTVPASDQVTAIQVRIQDGTLVCRNRESEESVELPKVNMAVVCQRDGAMQVEGSFGALEAVSSGGQVLFEYRYQNTEKDPHRLKLTGKSWPLDQFTPLLGRVANGARLQGLWEGSLAGAFPDDLTTGGRLDADLRLSQLIVNGGSAWQGDTLTLASAAAGGQITWDRQRATGKNLKLATDFANATWNGPLPRLDSLAGWQAIGQPLEEGDSQLHLTVDIAGLSRQFPHVLRLRDQVTVTDGTAELTSVLGTLDQKRGLHAVLRVTHLKAQTPKGLETWETPLEAMVRAHHDANGWTFDRAACRSEFLQAATEVHGDEILAMAEADLNKLLARLSRYAELGDLRLSGQARLDGRWTPKPDGRAEVAGEFTIRDWVLGDARAAWQEPRLQAQFQALVEHSELAGTSLADHPVKSATVKILAGEDQAELQWGPTPQGSELTTKIIGDLIRWQQRAVAWLPPLETQLGGSANLVARVMVPQTGLTTAQVSGTIQSLRVTHAGQQFADPEMRVDLVGSWEPSTSDWTVAKASLQGSTLNLTGESLAGNFQDAANWKAGGQLQANAEVGQLVRMIAPSSASSAPTGAVSAEAQFQLSPQEKRVRWTVASEGLVFSPQSRSSQPSAAFGQFPPSFSAPVSTASAPTIIPLSAAGELLQTGESSDWMLPSFSVKTTGFQAQANGELLQDGSFRTKGQLAYDWDALFSRSSLNTGKPSLRLSGKGSREFELAGGPRGFSQGYGGVGWTQGDAAGLVLGPADLSVRVVSPALELVPISIPVNEGRLQLAGQLRWDTTPALWSMPAGPVVQDLTLSEELCSQWLQFAAPMLANASQVQGRFSVQSGGMSVPLDDWKNLRANGRLDIHSGMATPGPMGQQLMSVLSQLRTILNQKSNSSYSERSRMTLPEQQVPFELRDRRVYHQGLKVMLGETQIVSSGSVGWDETLDLQLQIPLHDRWLPDSGLASQLKGQTVSVAVRGTFSQPQIDAAPLQDIARRMAGSAVERLIERKLPPNLERLLPFQR